MSRYKFNISFKIWCHPADSEGYDPHKMQKDAERIVKRLIHERRGQLESIPHSKVVFRMIELAFHDSSRPQDSYIVVLQSLNKRREVLSFIEDISKEVYNSLVQKHPKVKINPGRISLQSIS